jgi:hypothetical protein
MYIVAPEPISTAHFINPSHQSMCILLSFATQQIGKNVTPATRMTLRFYNSGAKATYFETRFEENTTG